MTANGGSSSIRPQRMPGPQHLGFISVAISISLLSWSGDSLVATDAFCSSCRSAGFRHHRGDDAHAFLPRARLLLANSVPPDDEDDEIIDDTGGFQKALSDLFKISSGAKADPPQAYSIPDLEGLIDPSTGSDEEVFRSLLEISEKDASKANVSDTTEDMQFQDDDTDADGMFLEEEVYLNSRDLLNPDGSLNLPTDTKNGFSDDAEYRRVTEQILIQHPDLPASLVSQEEDNPTLESLMRQRPHDPSATSEELHRQVFENEEGYLKQSELFRESLGADGGDAARKAAKLRRGANFCRRQEQAVSKLEEQIADFEANLENIPNQPSAKCFKCGCLLSEEEMAHSLGMQGPKRLCSLCYADILVAQSDKSFIREEPPSRTRMSRYGSQNASRDRKRGKSPTRPMIRPPLTPPQGRQPPQHSGEGRDKLDGDAPSSESRRHTGLEARQRVDVSIEATPKGLSNGQQVNGDQRSEEAPKKDDTGRWAKVEDPDTGEVFYWNEDTEEMKWEL